jgi:hypothetical protein
MSFSVFPRVALPFPQLALLHSVSSVTCVQLGLVTVLGNRGCQFPWCALGFNVMLQHQVRQVRLLLNGLRRLAACDRFHAVEYGSPRSAYNRYVKMVKTEKLVGDLNYF